MLIAYRFFSLKRHLDSHNHSGLKIIVRNGLDMNFGMNDLDAHPDLHHDADDNALQNLVNQAPFHSTLPTSSLNTPFLKIVDRKAKTDQIFYFGYNKFIFWAVKDVPRRLMGYFVLLKM